MSEKKFDPLRSRKPGNPLLLLVLFSVLLMSLAGCGGKLPATVALTGVEAQEGAALLERVRGRDCSDVLDTDLSLEWQGYGQRRIIKATLQATRDGRFRFSGLDPLGRPFFILVTDGHRFTLVDNTQGRGYIGSVDSQFLRQYIPAGLKTSWLFFLLTAQLPGKEVSVTRFARLAEKKTYWYVFTLDNRVTREAELDPLTGLLGRQLLLGDGSRIILDARYEAYPPQTEGCVFPLRLRVEGEDLSGSLEITFTRFYRGVKLPETIFTLQIPDHFTVTEVE